MPKNTLITREYLDQKLSSVLSKALAEQTKDLKGYVDKKNAELSTDLKAYIKTEIDELAGMTAEGFRDMQKRLDVTDRLDRVEKFMFKVAEALSISVNQ